MLFLGVDFGTSGARAVVLNRSGEAVAEVSLRFASQQGASQQGVSQKANLVQMWVRSLHTLIEKIAPNIRLQLSRIAVNGTSSTTLLCDAAGAPITEPLLYNDASARPALSHAKAITPANSPAASATSTLTKALWLHPQHVNYSGSLYLAHQADWLSYLLHRQPKITDYHNALKLGYDVKTLSYPNGLLASPIAAWLPRVIAPGEPIAAVHPDVAKALGLCATCQVCAGTTDSIAAFLASGATQAGEAVTSLGSTLVLKLLSAEPIEDQTFGIYSHRLGNLWLAGGASNTGGAVLSKFFSPEQLANLSSQIDPAAPCDRDYYPLNTPGERFPINDPDYPPRLAPRPERDRDFLHGLLDGMARIEADGYQKLNDLGAPKLKKVYTAGGGAKNETWRAIRQQKLGVDVVAASQTEAAYGTALLAMRGLSRFL